MLSSQAAASKNVPCKLWTVSNELLSPVLSVGVTTRNRWSLCARAIDSILRQNHPVFEIIVVDDASEEEIPLAIRLHIDTLNIRYFRQNRREGLAAARNRILAEASGSHVAFCDDDDWWPPNVAASLIEPFENDVDLGAVIGLPEWQRKPCAVTLPARTTIRELMLAGVTPPTSCQAYNLDLLRSVGGYCPRVPSGVDHDLWVQLSEPNPAISIRWGVSAVVDSRPSASRMTSRRGERESGLNLALELWRPTLVNVFGANFYRHFRRSLMARIFEGFVYQNAKQGRWLMAASIVLRHPVVAVEIVLRIMRRTLDRKPCGNLRRFKKIDEKGSWKA